MERVLLFVAQLLLVLTMVQQDRPQVVALELWKGAEGRRSFLRHAVVAGVGSSLSSPLDPAAAWAAPSTTTTSSSYSRNGLASKLLSRDPQQLRNPLFNVPPAVQVYPPWMRGEWQISSHFSGYLFPSATIPKSQLMQDVVVPGFQKCSIAATADVGKESVPAYSMRIDAHTGWEDRPWNLSQVLNAYLGYTAVQSVVYNGGTNPNRVSIAFVPYRTVNAERIELFCNARDSEEYTVQQPTGPATLTTTRVFVASEHIKQVTFGTGSTVGVPRQVTTNYGLYWTWQQSLDDSSTMQGNLLVAAYLDPQDALYFQEPTNPVVVYSHALQAQRQTQAS